jgi:O-antigen ligase
MPRKRKGPVARGKLSTVAASAAPPADVGGAIAAAGLLLSIAAAGLFVDSGADAAFDAPKRIATLFFVAVSALAAFGFSRRRSPFPGRHPGKVSVPEAAALLLLLAGALALVSAAASARRALAFDTARAGLISALLLPLGASRVLEKWKAHLLAAFLAIAAGNAAVSALQARNIYQPFPLVVTQGSRDATGAFVGNPGSLALALALAAIGAIGLALLSARWPLKVAAGAAAAVFGAGLLVNRNLTSWSALVAGTGILLLARFGRKAALPIALLVLLAGTGILVYRPMRRRAVEAVSAIQDRDWDRLVTYRLGAWAAAVEMTRERPWTGFGPGTYGAELVPHRLRAEIEIRKRMANPLLTSAYGEAHCDYLQFFAEAGIPAGVALLGAVFLLLRGLLRACRRSPPGPDRNEAILLLAFLGGGAVAALTWFPLQRPLTAVPLLLAAGRAWRISTAPTVPAPALPAEGKA